MITFSANVNTGLDGNFRMTWVVQSLLDLGTRYWASMDCVIGGNTYIGTYIEFGGVGEVDQSVNILGGGGVASVGNCSLALNEIVTVDGVHSEIAPQDTAEEISNRTVRIGVIYNDGGTLNDSDIAWLYTGVIEDWSSTRQTLELSLIGAREIETISLPKVVVDKTLYPNCPDEAVGKPLPILYGDWSVTTLAAVGGVDITLNWLYDYMMCFPTICVDQLANTFMCAGHAVNQMVTVFHRTSEMKGWALIRVLAGVSTYADVTLTAATATIEIPAGTIVGYDLQLFSSAGFSNNATDFKNAIDGDVATFASMVYGGNDRLSLVPSRLPNGKIPTDSTTLPLALILMAHLDSLTTFSIDMYRVDDNTLVTSHSFAPATDDLSACYLYDTNYDVSEIANYQFQVVTTGVGDAAYVKAFAIMFQYIISQAKFATMTTNVRRSNGSRESY